jgi:hypothetical protein
VVFIWNKDQLVLESEDGPQIIRPLPLPLQAGTSEDSSDATPETAAGASAEPATETVPESSRILLPAGSYLFCQGRLGDITSIEQTLEWFFREVWWTRATCRGPVYLRFIREDGKTAIQVIMKSAKED